MQLGRVVLKLRTGETSFSNRIGGAAELALAMNFSLKDNSAFVIPLVESAGSNTEMNSVNQIITERYGVTVALKNDMGDKDKLGLKAYDELHDIRAELIKILVGWDMGYEGITYYRGGRLLGIDRAWLWYQFEFEYTSRVVSDEDGFGEIETTTVDERQQWSQLPDFTDIWAQYILYPSVAWEDVQEFLRGEGDNLPLPDVDMESWVDMNEQYTGAFAIGFAGSFDFYKEI